MPWGFPYGGPMKEMIRIQSLPLHVSRIPQCRSPPSSFPLRTVYKGRFVPFSNSYLAFGVPSTEVRPSSSSHRAPTGRDFPFPEPTSSCLSVSPVNDSFYRFSNGALVSFAGAFLHPSPAVSNKQSLLIKQNLTFLSKPPEGAPFP